MKQKILSGIEAGFPVLRIDKKNYNDCWFDTLSSFLKAHQQSNAFSKETLTTFFSRKAPTLLYDRFLERYGKDGNDDRFFDLPSNPSLRAKWYRESLFESLFKRLERKRMHHQRPSKLYGKKPLELLWQPTASLYQLTKRNKPLFFVVFLV